MTAGIAVHPSLPGEYQWDRFVLSADEEKPSGGNAVFRAGLEGIVSRLISLRAGYERTGKNDSGPGLSFGLGFWSDFQPVDVENEFTNYRRDPAKPFLLEIDYAYIMEDVFKSLHRVTLTFHF